MTRMVRIELLRRENVDEDDGLNKFTAHVPLAVTAADIRRDPTESWRKEKG